VSVDAVTCLRGRCLETALVYLLISRSLHSNGCTRYTMITSPERSVFMFLHCLSRLQGYAHA
jgi:hypothetical protein